MTYEEFKKELYRNLQLQELSHGKQIILLEKGNVFVSEDAIAIIRLINLGNYGREDLILREDIICVVWKRKGIHELLHWSVRTVFERFKREGWQGVLPEMVSKICRTGNGGNSQLQNSYASERDFLIIKPLYYPRYRGELENGIYWIYGDIALTLHLSAYEGETDLLTMKINRDMVEKWDVTDEILLTNALLNTYAKMPPRLYYGSDSYLHHDRQCGVFMPEEKGKRTPVHPDDEQEGMQGYRVTTSRRRNGAVALFYPGVKERLAELMDGDYYVGFPSIHEAMIYPARHKVLSELKASIQHRDIMLEQRERLTNRVYRYSCGRKELIEV